MSNTLKHFYIITSSSNRYGKLLMENDYYINDDYDEYRKGAGSLPTLMKAKSSHLLQWIKGTPGKIIKVEFIRRVPKKVTNHLSQCGKGYNCSCWEIIVHYEVDGKEFINYTQITKSCL